LEIWTTSERKRVSGVAKREKMGRSDHPRLPVCDLIQLSVHVHVLHWRPTQPRWKVNDELDLGSKYKTTLRYLTISFVWQFLCGLNYKNLRRRICPFEGQQENCSPEQGHEALYKRGQDLELPTSCR
jgi:hypothetical protein